MVTVNVHEAKTHLSRLLKQVEAGEEVTIAPQRETRGPAGKQQKARQAEARLYGRTLYGT